MERMSLSDWHCSSQRKGKAMNQKSKLSRRQFVKRAAVISTVVVGGSSVLGGGKALLDKISLDKIIGQRDRLRPRDGKRWFIPSEYESASVLAALIIPSDETGPGAREAKVIERLDSLLATSVSRQTLYVSGLVGFDELARHEGSSSFAELADERQLELFQMVHDTYEKTSTGGSSLIEFTTRNLIEAYHTWPAPGGWRGFSAALELCPQLVDDVKQAFYTSTVGWSWLGYEGPPFPNGYLGRLGNCSANLGDQRV
jgi:Gluconate 2-dehydrogenase subunit 3